MPLARIPGDHFTGARLRNAPNRSADVSIVYKSGRSTINVVNRQSHLFRPKREPRCPLHTLLGSLGNANQLVNRVVQKASFRSPEFIGFFSPIFANRAGPLATVCWPQGRLDWYL
jgi:hypothetical protein